MFKAPRSVSQLKQKKESIKEELLYAFVCVQQASSGIEVVICFQNVRLPEKKSSNRGMQTRGSR